MKPSTFIKEAISQLPDLKTLENYLEQEFDTLVDSFPSQVPFSPLSQGTSSGLEAITPPMNDTPAKPVKKKEQERQLLEEGKHAVSKIRKEGIDAHLSPEEQDGFEAIVLLVGRPAILIQDGSFFRPPLGWEILEQTRLSIEETCRSVGRIEVSGHPNLDWIGTGFLVAKDIIMTNSHVAKEFCRVGPRRRWIFEPLITPSIDYIKELGALETHAFEITSVVGIHEAFDLALFRTTPHSSQGILAPRPFTLASKAPPHIEGRKVYALGYPAWDGRRNDPDIIHRIFSNIYGVKRLQPGEIVAIFEDHALLTHDCSTLNGNSGSCLVDVETNKVLGLHVKGRYRQTNYAVALWQLTSDPLLKKAKLCFE